MCLLPAFFAAEGEGEFSCLDNFVDLQHFVYVLKYDKLAKTKYIICQIRS